jgi:hypothetical protein
MPFQKGHTNYRHKTPWVSGKGVKSTKVLPPALIKAFNGTTQEGREFGLRCERLTFLNDGDLKLIDELISELLRKKSYTKEGN